MTVETGPPEPLDPTVELAAFLAYERQLHDQVYGGEADSPWCPDQAWRELDIETQRKLYRSGVIDSEVLAINTKLELYARFGMVDGSPAESHIIEGLVEARDKRLKTLTHVRQRLSQLRGEEIATSQQN